MTTFNWTDTVLPTDNIVRQAFWDDQVRFNLHALNDIIGHPDGGHKSLTDGGVLLGNGTGAIVAVSVLAKGSVIAGDGVLDPNRFVVGADDTILLADSSQAEGIKWDIVSWDVADAIIYGYDD